MTTWVKLRRNDDSVEVAGRSELAAMNAKSRFASSLLKLLWVTRSGLDGIGNGLRSRAEEKVSKLQASRPFFF